MKKLSAMCILIASIIFISGCTGGKSTTDVSGSQAPPGGNQPIVGTPPTSTEGQTVVAVPITDPIPAPQYTPIGACKNGVCDMRQAVIDINSPQKILIVGNSIKQGDNMFLSLYPVFITNIAFDRYKIAFDIENRIPYRNEVEYKGNTLEIMEIWINLGSKRVNLAASTEVGKFSATIPPGKKARFEIKFDDFPEDARNFIDTAMISLPSPGYVPPSGQFPHNTIIGGAYSFS